MQWGAVGMVFTGLLVSAVSKSKGHVTAKAGKGKKEAHGVALNAHGGAAGNATAAGTAQKKRKGL